MPKVRRVLSNVFCSKFHTLSSSVKFCKSFKIWQSYREFKGGNFLRHSVELSADDIWNKTTASLLHDLVRTTLQKRNWPHGIRTMRLSPGRTRLTLQSKSGDDDDDDDDDSFSVNRFELPSLWCLPKSPITARAIQTTWMSRLKSVPHFQRARYNQGTCYLISPYYSVLLTGPYMQSYEAVYPTKTAKSMSEISSWNLLDVATRNWLSD